MKCFCLAVLTIGTTAFMANAQEARMGGVIFGQNAPSSAWWDDRTGGWVGGIGGSVIGLLGATIGTLTGMGRGRNVVFALLYVLIVIGAIATIVGIVALIQKQPYGVWYPLFLAGVLPLFLGIFLRSTIRKKFEMVEMQRMQAMDGK